MSVAARLSYFARSAAQSARHAPMIHVVAITTLALALFAVGLARGAAGLMDSVLRSLEEQVELTVFVRDAVPLDETEALARTLERSIGGRARVVTPVEALERLARELPELASALSRADEGALPASIEISLPPSTPPEALAALAQRALASPAVADVDYGHVAVERLAAISRLLRGVGIAALSLVLVTSIIIVASTLQLAMYARRAEIEIQKLVGATDWFVRAPLVLEGVLQGALGAALAVLGLWATSALVTPLLADALAFLGLDSLEPLITSQVALELLAAALGVGLAGSALAAGRFLRV